MNIKMNIQNIKKIEDLEKFMRGSEKIEFSLDSRSQRYKFILKTLVNLKYKTVRKKDKSLIKTYLMRVTGYSSVQIKRLIKKWNNGKLTSNVDYKRHKFKTKYGPTEIELLARADSSLGFTNGNAVKAALKREANLFKNKQYAQISQISVSHIYNIRKNSLQYSSKAIHYTKTKATGTPIGQRKKPDNANKPGFIRVDSVHQGDLNGTKGVYHINFVDEVTQWQVVCCVPVISNKFMIPALKNAFAQFPFKIINFHSDNGSEYINYKVSDVLQKSFITQTKSRSRKTNDQALVEGKNGSVIRKHIGRNHIPKKHSESVDSFYENYFNTFLNYHRVCGFATNYTDKRGKIRKKYDEYSTPYEKLKSLPSAENYLKNDLTFAKLDKIAYHMSDIEYCEFMIQKKSELFKIIKQN